MLEGRMHVGTLSRNERAITWDDRDVWIKKKDVKSPVNVARKRRPKTIIGAAKRSREPSRSASNTTRPEVDDVFDIVMNHTQHATDTVPFDTGGCVNPLCNVVCVVLCGLALCPRIAVVTALMAMRCLFGAAGTARFIIRLSKCCGSFDTASCIALVSAEFP